MTVTRAERHVALYAIAVDGEQIDSQIVKRVHEIRVQSDLRLPDTCTVLASFPTGRPGQPQPIDRHPFDIGRTLEVRLGEREGVSTTTLFSGDIVTLEPQFDAGAVSLLVRGYDRSHALLRSRRTRTFQNQTASDIVTKIVREAGLQPTCEASGDPHDFIQQTNETDWDFIWRLAERIGFEFVVIGDHAHFRAPDAGRAIELAWPTTLHRFAPRLTAVQQVAEVSLLAHDPKTKQPIDVTVSTPRTLGKIGIDRGRVARAFEGGRLHVATEPVKSAAEGRALAQAVLDKLASGYVSADGVTDGDPRLRAGVQVVVSGVGQQFGGTYRVASATHVIRGGHVYETHFSNCAVHSVSGRNAATPDFGSQLVLGIVTNNDDPQRMGRVRVRYPALGPHAEGAWARVATASAGQNRGLLMLPVVGEEVLVGFEHDDSTRPYVLGSLFNGQDLPGDSLLQSKDGSFAVRSDKNIYMESQGDYTLTSAGRLLVDSAGDVREQYRRDWRAQVDGTASLTTTGAFEIAGKDVTIKARSQLTIDTQDTLTLRCGSTQVQLSKSGVTVAAPSIKLG